SELQITKPLASEVVSISVYNYLGQAVNTWTAKINEPTVYLPIKVSSGAYIVQITTKTGPVVHKIIVE
ncbi:MAG: T9SS type A sorting domain-containing protein, partial [Lutibacter sp.]